MMIRAVVLLCLVSLAFADQPAVSITVPNQGSKWSEGSTVPTRIEWSKTNQIRYTNIEIALLDPLKGGLFAYPDSAIQFICGGRDGSPSCPPIVDGAIDFSWVLKPNVKNFLGQATIFVRALWDDVNSPGVIDTLQQTLTIQIIAPTPTPRTPTPRTPTPATPTPATPTPATPTPATPTPKTPTPATPTPKTPTPATPPPATPTPATPTPAIPTPATPTPATPPATPTPGTPTPTPSKKNALTKTPTPSKAAPPTPTGLNPPCQPKCPNDTMCCNDECVMGSWKSHFCCETSNYPYACLLGKENCCGFECCPLGQDCCGHGLTQVCCPSGTHCCGGTCTVGACPTGPNGRR